MTLCRDTFAGHPQSIVGLAGGASCETPVEGAGWMCPTHHAMAHQLLSTTMTDVQDERESTEPVDPEVKARIAEARAYLKACEARKAQQDDFTVDSLPSFVLDLLSDPRYGTKHFRITEKMADALIRTRDGEQARRQQAQEQTQATQPRAAEAIRWVQDNAPSNDFAGSLLQALRKWGRLTDRQYEAVIKNVDRAPAGASAVPVTEGWYSLDGAICKVQKAVHGSGNLYAKKLVQQGEVWTWEYVPGLIRSLTPELKLTVEEAQSFGKLYGVCAVCGRVLTDETSISHGIGPVCRGRLS